MGKVTIYLTLIFSISVVLYLLGAQSPFQAMMDSLDPTTPITDRVVTALTDAMSSQQLLFLLLAVGTVVGGSAIIGLNTSSVLAYGIPLVLFAGAMNFFVFPTATLFQTGMPEVVGFIVLIFLNILLLLGALEFVRGGAT